MQAPTLQEFKSGSERAYLVAKLRENGWNISKTAEVIDTPRSNLYKILEQYQISQEKDGLSIWPEAGSRKPKAESR
jgi:two-component system nitrogen regulation response regulator NtrX